MHQITLADTSSGFAFHKRTFTTGSFVREAVVLLRRGRALRSPWNPANLDPLLREQVMFAVAMVNDCKFCAFMHDAAAVEAGADRDGLARLVGLEPASVTDEALTAVVWAQSRAANGLGRANNALELQMNTHYSPTKVRDLDTVVRVMTVLNLSGNTAEALIRRIRRQAVPGSRAVDEVVVGGLYIAGALTSALSIAVHRRIAPRTVWREFVRFDGRSPRSAGSHREGSVE